MKTAITILFLLATAAYAVEPQVIDDFEHAATGRSVSGWGTWGESPEATPQLAIVSEAAGGEKALEITFPGSKTYSGLTRSQLEIPAGAETLTLYLKPMEGAVPSTLLLEREAADDGTREVFKSVLPAGQAGQWKRLDIPISGFVHAYTKGGKTHDKVLDRKYKYDLILIGYTQPHGIFLVDEISWNAASRIPGSTVKNPARRNRLTGDSSFETGIGDWMYYFAPKELKSCSGDGAVGNGCLELDGKSSWVRNRLMHDLIDGQNDYTLSFYAKSTDGSPLKVELITLNWKTLAGNIFKPDSGWRRYTLYIPKSATPEKVFLALSVPGNSGTVRIDALQLEIGNAVTEYQPAEALSLFPTVGRPGEIVTVGETPTLFLSFANHEIPIELQPLHVAYSDGGQIGKTLELTVNPGETSTVSIPLNEARDTGYYPVRITVRDRTGAVVAERNAPFVVAPAFTAAERDRYFGISVNHVPHEAMLRAGSTWTRGNSPSWLQTGGRPFSPPPPIGLKRLFTITDLTRPPDGIKQNEGLPENPEDLRPYVRELARLAGNDVAFELQNEPDLTLQHNTGASFQTAVERYAALLKVAYSELRKTPSKTLLNISGVGMPFAEEIFKRAGDSFDVFAPHPYAHPRFLGEEAGYCSTPEEGRIRENLLAAADMIRKYGNRQELWIGELGWALDVNAAPDSNWARQHADFLARTFLLSRTVPEMKRIIWFTALGCLEGEKYEYGIWRNDNGIRPLPAVAAFANLAGRMDRATEINLVSDNDLKIVSWRNDGIEQTAVWNLDIDSGPLTLEFVPTEATVADVSGKPLTGKFILTDSPVYLTTPTGGREAAIAKIHRAVAAKQPLLITGYLANSRELRLTLRNNLPESRLQEVRIGSGETITVKLPGRKTENVTVKLQRPVEPAGGVIQVQAGAITADIAVPPMTAVAYRNMADWRSYDFRQLKPVAVLSERKQVHPPDPTVSWNGPDDLSAKIYMMWDEKYLYIMADVLDDELSQPFHHGDIWKGDCLQFAFDCGNDAKPKGAYDNNDYEYGAAFGNPVWRWQAAAPKTFPAEATGVEAAVTVSPGGLIYRIAIPWRELSPLQPRAGSIAGFNLVLMDRDDDVCNYFMALAPGLSPFKNPSLFPKIILTR